MSAPWPVVRRIRKPGSRRRLSRAVEAHPADGRSARENHHIPI